MIILTTAGYVWVAPPVSGPPSGLVPGAGNWTAYNTAAAQGQIGSGTATAIAQWSGLCYPWQTVTTTLKVGVVAFHRDDIAYVDFYLDGGTPVRATAEAYNADEDAWMFYVTLDATTMSDANREIRAIVVPNSGYLLALTGALGNNETTRNGIHSFYVSTNAGGGLAATVGYARATGGSDSNNGLTYATACATVERAIQKVSAVQGNSDGIIIKCGPGTYTGQAASGTLGNTSRFLKVMPADDQGVTRSQVIFSTLPGGNMPLRYMYENVTISGMTVSANLGLFGASGSFPMLKDCVYVGPGYTVSNSYAISRDGWGIAKSWAINTELSNNESGLQGFVSIYGCYVHDTAAGLFIHPNYCQNSRGSTGHFVSGAHNDAFHWFHTNNNILNVIAYNVECHDFDGQGIFLEQQGAGDRMDRVAFVNVHISKNQTTSYGSWLRRKCDHFILWNCSIADQPFRIDTPASTAGNITNASVILSMASAWVDQTTPSTPTNRWGTDAILESNHTRAATFGSFTFGTDHTTSNTNIFVNEAGYDFTPHASGPLVNRRAPITPGDKNGDTRNTSLTAVGAFKAAAE